LTSNGVAEYTEAVQDPPYEGTIIDVETNHHDLPICVGSLCANRLSILYITDEDPGTWSALTQAVNAQLQTLPRPYLAFRAEFDQEVLAALLGRPLVFDGDLHVLPYSKDRTARHLGAPLIPDPLNGKSAEVPHHWDKYLRTHQPYLIDRIIKHNRACLLKETYIEREAGWKPISAYALTQPRITTMHPHDPTTQLLLQALRERRLVEATYHDSKGDTTTRQIAALSVGHQYFTGYCLLREELRTFKTSRVTNLGLLDIRLAETQLFLQEAG
jgi:hypothetical protein